MLACSGMITNDNYNNNNDRSLPPRIRKKNSSIAPVVQTLDSSIHRLNHYPAGKYLGNQLRYPLDRFLSGGQRYPALEQPEVEITRMWKMKTEQIPVVVSVVEVVQKGSEKLVREITGKHHPLGNSKDNIAWKGTYSREVRSYPSSDNKDRATVKRPRLKVWTASPWRRNKVS